MSSCQDELFKRDAPSDYEVRCVYCGVLTMRSQTYHVPARLPGVVRFQYACTVLDACKERLRTEIRRAAGMPREDRPPTKLIGKVKVDVSDPETKKIWDAAVAAKEEVESWPAWKRGHLVQGEQQADFKIDRCDACGAGNMQEMSGCKRLCRQCGYMRTCNDTV